MFRITLNTSGWILKMLKESKDQETKGTNRKKKADIGSHVTIMILNAKWSKYIN